MDEDMLDCIRALAENRIQDAKDKAIICCINDTTKKNASKTSYYKKLLENGSTKMFELPLNLKGLLNVQDVSDFNEARYYLGKEQKKTYEQIVEGVNSTLKMLEYGIPYMNSTLIYGEPGTGKTEFAKYVAFKLGLPYAYLNFSYLIDSYMGKTAQNLNRIFDYCKGQKCVLMLDEIDCIGIERGHLRRFQRQVEFKPFDKEERQAMIEAYMNSVDSSFLTDDIVQYADESHTQAEIIKFLIEQIVNKINE